MGEVGNPNRLGIVCGLFKRDSPIIRVSYTLYDCSVKQCSLNIIKSFTNNLWIDKIEP